MTSLVDLAQQEQLLVGWPSRTLVLSESTLNLALSLLSPLDDPAAWEDAGEELTDEQIIEIEELLGLAYKELCEEEIVGGEVYVNRGDPYDFDYELEDLEVDGDWHVLDLSSIVLDAGATIAHIRLLAGAEVPGQPLSLRKAGNEWAVNTFSLIVQSDVVYSGGDGLVALDESLQIEYNVSTGINFCGIVVRGWWRPA
jgi:hypothetical protein